MKAVESGAEVYLMALQSLSNAEKEAVIARFLEDTNHISNKVRLQVQVTL